ncbi:hypothetical protein PAHAL_5G101100 [Panicum hallii]|uniref:Uncharacterized protein n=1 Tax=Panicum hallii TaxID=206008 RepID=A0A2T8IJI1_9POAL|nr:hypothetical protein PAHAL_5G101100 [Panicum hallii]
MSENPGYKIQTHPSLPNPGILHPALAFSTPPASSSAGHQELSRSSRAREEGGGEEASNGVRVPLQRLRRQQGEEAAAQAGAAQAADRQDPAGQPRGAGRQEQGPHYRSFGR